MPLRSAVVACALAFTAALALPVGSPAEAELTPGEIQTWGVSGLQPSASNNFQSQVSDFEQIGDVVYVAGKFTEAVSGSGGRTVTRVGVAGFSVDDGELVEAFDPDVRGGPVYGLASSPDQSRLFITGEFTSVDGATDTAGLAALDPTTGRLDPTWRAGLERPWTDDPPVGRDVEVSGGQLYVGGNFSHIRSSASVVQVNRLGRVALDSGQPDTTFRPTVSGGGIWDLDVNPSGDRLYLAGYFTSVNGDTELGSRFAALQTSDGSLVEGLGQFEPSLETTGRQYAVLATDDLVFVAGEEHTLQVLDASTNEVVQTYFTGSPSFISPHPLQGGGDYQALEQVGDRVYAGCHCWNYHLSPSVGGQRVSALTLPDGDWTPIRAVTAYDSVTGEHLPDVSFDVSGTSGAWALLGDDEGCLWVGGGLSQSAGSWISGFGRWCDEGRVVDSERPSPPKDLVLDASTPAGVSLRWTASSDNVGVTGYQIHRTDDDSAGPVVGTSMSPNFIDATAIAGIEYRYVVKALDAAGNSSWRSNTLDVVAGASDDTERPSPPRGLEITNAGGGRVAISWRASTDNVGVVSYTIHRSTTGDLGPALATTAGTSFADGSVDDATAYTYAIKAIDEAGNESWRSNLVTSERDGRLVDGERPTPPSGLRVEVVVGGMQLLWTESTDNVGVVDYRVHRSKNDELGDVLGTGTSGFIDTTAEPGVAYTYAIKAVDAAGNVSWRSNLAAAIAP